MSLEGCAIGSRRLVIFPCVGNGLPPLVKPSRETKRGGGGAGTINKNKRGVNVPQRGVGVRKKGGEEGDGEQGANGKRGMGRERVGEGVGMHRREGPLVARGLPCEEGQGVSSHPMGAMWDEPGWLHKRVGQISKRVRAQLMAKSEFELKVVDSGVW